ncbi:L-threonine dehydratase catabolic TdcB [Gimesia panareensis]|uniref:L-threonine dehydratase catabolic TdcB n=1 Tax=Gimesia panareensis TaxID=2527978 RepID=A0A518FVN6_9PLAN|nr:threonine/serine dehydratase [Gimesia panareensis]QDV20413.1 L-threonine dehydratase catabolic TdcB [Gimesia panareensis]
MQAPTFQDIQEALPRVRQVLAPTPLYEWPGLCELTGTRFFLKHENHQPVGAFKVRGGINLVSTLSEEERAGGIMGCSTGNHGQSLAFAARRFGVQCTIVVPRNNNPDKVRAIRLLGAEIIEAGEDFNEAKHFLETELVDGKRRYVHSANEPKLIAGVGTQGLEIFESLPDPDVVIVPVGMGSGVCGTGIVAKHLSPKTEVIAVQAEKAPANQLSWKAGSPQTTETAQTWAEGVATRAGAELTRQIMQSVVDDFLLVGEDEMRLAAYHILKETHNLAEGAGAAALAAVLKYKDRFAGKKVVAVLSGGNLNLAELPEILRLGSAQSA